MDYKEGPILEGDVIEPEEWRNPEAQSFNHQVLVMTAVKNIIEAGKKELIEGWWEEKADRMGNIHKTYHPDTRKEFIGSVKGAMMVMRCDFDDEAKDNVKQLIEKIEARKEYWLEQEWLWWNSLNPMQRKALTDKGQNVSKGFFNRKLNFDNYFFEEEADLYWEIATELNELTKRLDFYGEMGYSN